MNEKKGKILNYLSIALRILSSSHRLTLDLWFAKDNRFLNPKSSYEMILTAPPCRLIKEVNKKIEPTGAFPKIITCPASFGFIFHFLLSCWPKDYAGSKGFISLEPAVDQ